MERLATTPLRIGAWFVNPVSGQISREGEIARLEARTMRLLLCLASRGGEVVSIDDLLREVWSEVTVTPDSVYQAVASLRRVLGDDPKQPTYIATVPRLGYRLVAPVSRLTDQTTLTEDGQNPRTEISVPSNSGDVTVAVPAAVNGASRHRAGFAWAAVGALSLALVAGFLFAFLYHSKLASHSHSASSITPPRQQSIAVLPFLDLTQDMHAEPFADGMTEELIDRFSKIPGLRVPSPTASFYFKNKKLPILEIAKKLGVVCVLDGSVRKSGTKLRVAARLIRADNGYVIWSETYDKTCNDLLAIQDEIAEEVTKRLRASIEEKPNDEKSE